MPWLENLFGSELSMGVQVALLLVILVVALLLIFWLFRKIFNGSGARLSKSRQPRLSVTDAAVVDDKRRLVLVRRDNVEHLLMIGGPTDIVIEQTIVRAAPVSVPPTLSQQTAQPATPPVQTSVAPAPQISKPVEPAPVATPSKIEPEASSMFSGDIGKSAVAVGGAALAGAGAMAISAKDHMADAGADLADAARDTASNTSSAVKDAVGNTATQISDTAEKIVEPASESESVIDDLSNDLENALASEATPVEAPVETKSGQSKTEDEMQRLLKELAAGN